MLLIQESFVMNKEIIKIVIKVLLYALGLIGSYFGVSALTSCTVQRTSQCVGRSRIIITDTTDIEHTGEVWIRPFRRR